MVDPGADDRAGGPALGGLTDDGAAAGSLLPGLDRPVEQPADRRHGRRALWMSIAALAVVAAVAWPVAGRLLRTGPERVRTPGTLAGLTLDRDPGAMATAEYLRGAIAAGMDLDRSVGAVYSHSGNVRDTSVIFVGGNTTSGSAASRLDALFGLLDDGTTGFTQVTAETPGQLGGLVRCALSTDSSAAGTAGKPAAVGNGGKLAICGWADATTVGVALFPSRTVDQAAALIGRMRPGLLGQG